MNIVVFRQDGIPAVGHAVVPQISGAQPGCHDFQGATQLPGIRRLRPSIANAGKARCVGILRRIFSTYSCVSGGGSATEPQRSPAWRARRAEQERCRTVYLVAGKSLKKNAGRKFLDFRRGGVNRNSVAGRKDAWKVGA